MTGSPPADSAQARAGSAAARTAVRADRPAARAGAHGFLLKDTPPRDIVRAVRSVPAGETMLSPAVVGRLVAQVVQRSGENGQSPRAERTCQMLERLTGPERDVALAIGDGLSNAQISASTSLSVATVKAYVSRILTKLECSNRVQIAILVHEARD